MRIMEIVTASIIISNRRSQIMHLNYEFDAGQWMTQTFHPNRYNNQKVQVSNYSIYCTKMYVLYNLTDTPGNVAKKWKQLH